MLLSHWCTNPIRWLLLPCFQLEAWRNSITSAFKPAAQVIGRVSGRRTISRTIFNAYNVAPLLWSLIKIIMKSQEEATTPDHSKINQQKPRIRLICLYANPNLCVIYVYLIVKYSISLNPNPYIYNPFSQKNILFQTITQPDNTLVPRLHLFHQKVF